MEKYPLTEIEADIQPEDFDAQSVWHDLVKYCGPASVVILAKYKENVSDHLAIRDYSGFTRKAQSRMFRKNFSHRTPLDLDPVDTP